MDKILLILVLWIVLDIATPLSFAFELEGTAKQVIQVEAKNPESPSSALPPEMKCGACAEVRTIEVKPIQNPSSSPYLSPSPSGADVKGVQEIPEPTPKKIIKPIVKPVISPSPSVTPSASISVSLSPEPTPEPFEKKQTSPVEYVLNWILQLFR